MFLQIQNFLVIFTPHPFLKKTQEVLFWVPSSSPVMFCEDPSDIFGNFLTVDVTPRQGNAQDTHCQRTVDAFKNHFNPQTSTEYQTYTFLADPVRIKNY